MSLTGKQGRLLTLDEVHRRLEAAVAKAGTAHAYAQKIGISDQYLSDMRQGARGIGLLVAEDLGVMLCHEWREGTVMQSHRAATPAGSQK